MEFDDIAALIGDDRGNLLKFDNPKVPKEKLAMPGPDWVDRVLAQTDRSPRVLKNIQSLFDHGRPGSLNSKSASTRWNSTRFCMMKNSLTTGGDNGITLTAYSPLAHGNALDNGVIREIAEKYSKTPARITLRWEIQKGALTIPKAASPAHLEENISIFDFKLEEEDVEHIDSIPEFKRFVSLDTP